MTYLSRIRRRSSDVGTFYDDVVIQMDANGANKKHYGCDFMVEVEFTATRGYYAGHPNNPDNATPDIEIVDVREVVVERNLTTGKKTRVYHDLSPRMKSNILACIDPDALEYQWED